jgi:peroxiredoxin
MNQLRCKRTALAISIPGAVLLFVLAGSVLHDEEGLSTGETLPSAVLRSIDGSETNTRSWRGLPTVLVLFRSSCPACGKQIENLAVASAEFPDVRVALLSLGDASSLEKTAFPVYFDPEGEFVKKVRRLRVPTLYWVDADGKVKYVRTGCREAAFDISLFRSLLENNQVLNPLPLPHPTGHSQDH